jgi:Ni,Fe-hydrogenase III small subunit
VASVVPVDLVIRGCPPTPSAILKGLLTLLETTASRSAAPASA